MFTISKLGGVAHKLAAVAVQVRWLFWAIAGYWLGRFLVTQDPVELLLAAATLVLIHFAGLLRNLIPGAPGKNAKAHDAGATEAEFEEEVVPTQE